MNAKISTTRLEVTRLNTPLDLVAGIDRRWLAAWVAIFLVVTVLNITTPYNLGFATRILAYIGIVSCFIYASATTRYDHWLLAALATTLLADLFLIVLAAPLPGIAVFCVVQVIHAIRLRQFVRTSPILYVTALVVMFVAGIFLQFSLIFMLAAFYACTILYNCLAAKKLYDNTHQSITSARMFWGFVAFIVCDIFVGLDFLINEGFIAESIPVVLIAAATYVFYFPSQILLASSGTRQPSTTRVK